MPQSLRLTPPPAARRSVTLHRRRDSAISLARLWRDQGKLQRSSRLFAPVYGWFTEGLDTRDLKDAKALVEELAT